MPQTASEGLKALPNLVAELRRRIDEIEMQATSAQYQWAGLGKVGGQRDDHAGELLRRVRSEVGSLAKFVNRVEDQMVSVIVNPFGSDEVRKKILLEEQNLVIL